MEKNTKLVLKVFASLVTWLTLGLVSVGIMIWSVFTESWLFWPADGALLLVILAVGRGWFIPDEMRRKER